MHFIFDRIKPDFRTTERTKDIEKERRQVNRSQETEILSGNVILACFWQESTKRIQHGYYSY